MFGSILGAVLAHKQVVIAALAISGLVIYAVPNAMMPMANADHRPVSIDRTVELRCLPYCQTAADVLGDGFERVTPGAHIRIGFSFLPR